VQSFATHDLAKNIHPRLAAGTACTHVAATHTYPAGKEILWAFEALREQYNTLHNIHIKLTV